MSVQVINGYGCRLADLEVPDTLSRQLRRADDFIRLGIVAAYHALNGTVPAPGAGERVGLYLGSAFGPMQTNFDVLDQVVEREPVSPTLFSHSVFNAAAGYIASVLGIHGAAMTLTDFTFPFFRSLEQGLFAVQGGGLDYCLVLQVESYSALLQDARREFLPDADPWQPAAVCWLVGNCTAGEPDAIILDGLRIDPHPCSPRQLLSLQEEIAVEKQIRVPAGDGFAGAALWLTEAMGNTVPGPERNVRVTSPSGNVELSLQLTGRDRETGSV